MSSVRFYIHRRVFGKYVILLHGNVAWELDLGRCYVQVFYRRFWRSFGLVKVGRL